MKKFITLLTLIFAMNANAGLLTIDFSAEQVSVGDSVLVTINAENFDETDMFYFDLNFNSAVMAYDETSLNSDLVLFDASLGEFNGLEVLEQDFGASFDFFTDASPFAAGDFVLASFNLIANSEGLTNFSITDFFNPAALSDYTIDFSGTDSINVSAIPEPTSIALLMLAGCVLISTRRKVK